MSSPAPTIHAAALIGDAVRRLADPARAALCVVDDDLHLVGLLTRRELLAVYRRPDDQIAADVHAAVEPDRLRPTRDSADLTVEASDGVVTLHGALTYRSQVDHACLVASRVAGVVAVHNKLTYDIDDMHVTGF